MGAVRVVQDLSGDKQLLPAGTGPRSAALDRAEARRSGHRGAGTARAVPDLAFVPGTPIQGKK